MHVAQWASTETLDAGRQYADDRLRCLYRDHNDKLRKKFLRAPQPETQKDVEKWLKDGEYHFDVPEDYEDGQYDFYHPFDFFNWGKKEWKPDRKGFKKADEALDEAYAAARDVINITTDENRRLEAIQTFEKWKH